MSLGTQHTIIKFYSSFDHKNERDSFLSTIVFIPLIIIIPISTLNKKDILFLKNKIRELILELNKNVSTSEINKWLNHVVENNSHPRINGKEVKFKYGTQVSKNPLTIKIFSNFSKEISNSYKRYLLNNFYNFFKIKSRNLKILFSKSKNPYD